MPRRFRRSPTLLLVAAVLAGVVVILILRNHAAGDLHP